MSVWRKRGEGRMRRRLSAPELGLQSALPPSTSAGASIPLSSFRGRGQGEGNGIIRFHMPSNDLQDGWRLQQDFVVPKPQHPIPERLQESCPFGVFGPYGLGAVLIAVDFHNKPGFGAEKVGHKRSDGMLTTKLFAGQPSASEVMPQKSFGIGLVLAKKTGCGSGGVWFFKGFHESAWRFAEVLRFVHTGPLPPHPDPLPLRGGREEVRCP